MDQPNGFYTYRLVAALVNMRKDTWQGGKVGKVGGSCEWS
jgi:hypothetical protein